MKFHLSRIIILLLAISSVSHRAEGSFLVQEDEVNQDTAAFVSPYEEDNQRCFKCHGQSKYQYTNESLGKEIKAHELGILTLGNNR